MEGNYNNMNNMNLTPDFQNHQEPEKKKNPYLTKKMGAVIMALCIVAAGGGGFAAGVAANGLSADSASVSQTQPAGTVSTAVSGSSSSNASAMASSNSSSGALTVEEIADKVCDSVVEITTEVTQYDSYMRQYVSEGAGSGVIISADGYIITNNHVIEDASSITVTLRDGTSYPATLVGTDAETDIAIIKIEATGLKAATIGNSSELEVGDIVVAIGNPLGQLGGTVTDGIVSALDRTITTSDGETRNLMQTNAAVNPGNSGGGLFNDRGELIGIVNAKTSETGVEGLGFAIPIDDVKDIINDLMENGYVTGRPFMGATLVTINSPQTMMQAGVDRTGVYIYSLVENGASEQAGLQVGDYVLMVDGTVVSTSDEVKNIIRDHEVGDTVTFTILRGNETLEIPVTLAEQPAETASSGANSGANNG